MRTIKVVVRARDEMVGAFLREKLRAIEGIEVVEPGATTAESCVVDAQLLTPAERRVLQAFLQYDRIAEVARHLFVTPETVKKHLQRIYLKLGVRSLHRALSRSVELGLLSVSERCP